MASTDPPTQRRTRLPAPRRHPAARTRPGRGDPEQAGPHVFELVEGTRPVRSMLAAHGAGTAELAARLDGLSDADALHAIRASILFAPRQHRRGRAPAPPARGVERPGGPGSLRFAVERLQAAGLASTTWRSLPADARLVSPVITAHPTEVRRKTVLDAQREIVRLLARRPRRSLDDAERADLGADAAPPGAHALADGDAAAVATPRARRDQRGARLLRAVAARAGARAAPGAGGRARATMAGPDVRRAARAAHGFVDRWRPRRQSVRHRRRPAVRDRSPERPSRSAITSVSSSGWRPSSRCPPGSSHAARPARATGGHGSGAARNRAGSDTACRARPLPDPCRAARAICSSWTRRCAATAPASSPTRALGDLIWGVDVFGYRLCGVDLRQNSEVHEVVVGELLALAGVTAFHTTRCRRRSGAPCSTPSWRRHGRSPVRTCASANPPGTSSKFSELPPTWSPASDTDVLPHYVISKCQAVSDVLEVATACPSSAAFT